MRVARHISAAAVLLSMGCTAILGIDDYDPGTREPSTEDPADALAERTSPTPGDGGAREAAQDGDGAAPSCPSTQLITEAEVDALASWKAPSAFQNVCTPQNIDDLKALFNATQGAFTAAAARRALGEVCAACAVSRSNDPTWQVIIDDGSSLLNNGLGSCLAIRRGNACGQAAFRLEACAGLACPFETCGGGGGEAQCVMAAQQGACRSLDDAYLGVCPTSDAPDFAICSNLFGALAAVCGGGPTM